MTERKPAYLTLPGNSDFPTSVLYNFCWERTTKSQFAALVDEISLYHIADHESLSSL